MRSVKDQKKYIGSTTDVQRRLNQHNAGRVPSTKYRLPFSVEFVLEYATIEEAAIHEKKFKRSSGALERALKKAIKMHGD